MNSPPLMRTRVELSLLDKQKDSSCAKVWVHRLGKSHWNAHSRRDYKERDIYIVRLDDIGSPYQQFALMPFGDLPLYASLQIETEMA
jgi:hypothetical protein